MMDTSAPASELLHHHHHLHQQQQQQGLNGSVKSISSLANSIHLNNNHLTTVAPYLCSGCGRPIVDQYLLKALDCYWHEDCLKCGCCDCRLGEVGSTLYTKANLILCKRDYLRMFGTSGSCAACSKSIPAFEMVMRAKSNVYHLDCFACQQCHQRFCVGDRFYLCDNKILCEYDYEERLVMSQTSNNQNAAPNAGPTGVQHIQRRVTDIHQQQQQPGGGSLAPVISPPYFGYRHFNQQQQQQQLMFPMGRHHQLVGQQLKHGSPSDGSSSGYGSPDSVLLEDR